MSHLMVMFEPGRQQVCATPSGRTANWSTPRVVHLSRFGVVTQSGDVGHSHHLEAHERLADLVWFGNEAELRARIGYRE